MTIKSKLNQGQRELHAACRFFRGETKRGARWLRLKVRNRIAALAHSHRKATLAATRRSS